MGKHFTHEGPVPLVMQKKEAISDSDLVRCSVCLIISHIDPVHLSVLKSACICMYASYFIFCLEKTFFKVKNYQSETFQYFVLMTS